MFKTSLDQKYFNIILLDFLNAQIFGIEKNCIEGLDAVLNEPRFSSEVSFLSTTLKEFKDWLSADIVLEHDGETRTFWFPNINKDIALKIKREEFIKICGNISKHNPLGLDKQAKTIVRIFQRNNLGVGLSEALLIMNEFYEQFHNELLNYHSSTIAEFLNNLRWGIYEYIKPLYNKSVEVYWDYALKMRLCRYHYPETIINPYAREIYWDLMNDVRSEPYIKKFTVTRYLKMRY